MRAGEWRQQQHEGADQGGGVGGQTSMDEDTRLDRCQGGGVAAGGVFEVSDPAGCVSGQV